MQHQKPGVLLLVVSGQPGSQLGAGDSSDGHCAVRASMLPRFPSPGTTSAVLDTVGCMLSSCFQKLHPWSAWDCALMVGRLGHGYG